MPGLIRNRPVTAWAVSPGLCGEEFALACDAAGVGTWQIDLRTGRMTLSGATRRLLGFGDGTHTDLRVFLHRIHPQDRRRVTSLLRRVIARQAVPAFGFRVRVRAGEVRHLSCHGSWVRDDRGEVKALVGIVTDLTPRRRAETALAETEAGLCLIADAAGLGTWHHCLSTDGVIWDERCRTHFGLRPDEPVTTERFYQLLHPDDRQAVRQAAAEAVRRREPFGIDFRVTLPDGRTRWIHATGRPRFDGTGRALRFDGITIDVTERKQAEQVLRLGEERYRTLLATTSDIVWTTDPEGRFIEPQPSWQSYTGQAWSEHQDFGWVNAVHPDDRAPLLHAWHDALARLGLYETRGRLWHAASASYHHFVVRAAPLIEEDGRVREWIGTVADIDPQKRAEQELRASEERFRVLCTGAPLVIFQTDAAGRCTYQSPQWERMTGYPTEAALGFGWLDAVHAEDRPMLLEGWDYAARNGVRWEREYRMVTAAGETRWVHALASPIFGAPDHLIGYVGTVEDITERKWAETELQKYREGLERMVSERTLQLRELYMRLQTVREEEKAAIARELHDELGATLTVLNLDVLWMKEQLPENSPLAAKAAAVGELLTQAVQAARRIQTELRPALLDDLGLASAIAWQAREFEKHTGIECRVELDESVNVPPACATALFRIFQESLTNVVKHAKARRVSVSLTANDREVRLSVTDDGVGLGDGKRNDATSFGIRGMIERARFLGGAVELRDRPGGGTEVEVAVPAHALFPLSRAVPP